MAKNSKAKLHHYVPRLYLRNFADDREQVAVVDRKEGRSYISNIANIAAETHFYATQDESGEWGVEFEEALADFEGRIAPAIHSIVQDDIFPPADEHRHLLALFIASQWTRGPRVREQMAQSADWLLKAHVAMGGKGELRKAMTAAGLDASDEAVDQEWAEWTDFDSYTWEPHQNEHMSFLTETLDKTASLIANASFLLVRFSKQKLITSDTVVSLYRAPHPENAFLGVGLLTADEVHVPLARNVALILMPQEGIDGHRLTASTAMAKHINLVVAANSRRWIFHHPEDSPLDGIELPPWSEQKMRMSGLSPKDLLPPHDAAERIE